MAVPTKIAFETRYSDDSGVEHAVRYDANAISYEIEVEAVSSARFPIDKIDWLIESLQAIRGIARPAPPDSDAVTEALHNAIALFGGRCTDATQLVWLESAKAALAARTATGGR